MSIISYLRSTYPLISKQGRVSPVLYIVLPAIAATSIYLSVSLLAFRYRTEAHGVVARKVVPNIDHWPVAQELMDGQGLTYFVLPPGFSIYIVSALHSAERWGGSYYLWRLVQDSLSTAISAILIMSLMRWLTASAWAGWSAVLALVYNLTYSAGTSADLAMASFMPWFLGSLLLLVQAIDGTVSHSRIRAFMAGSLLAVSGFIRPEIALFLPFLAIVFWSCRRLSHLPSNHATIGSARYSPGYALSTALLGFGLISLPWVAYASARSQSIMIYSTYFVSSHIDGMVQFPGNPVSETFRRLWPELNSVFDVIGLHLSLLQAYPGDWLWLWADKIWRPWYASESGKWNLLLAIQSFAIAPPVLGGIYLWIRRRGLDLGFIISLGVISYFWLIAVSVWSINRYMPPAYPFLGMFMGFSAHVLLLKLFQKRSAGS